MGKGKGRTTGTAVNNANSHLPAPILCDGPTSVENEYDASCASASACASDTILVSSLRSANSLTDQIKYVKSIGTAPAASAMTPFEFRILLEWMCSEDIPQNLRRCLQSTLKKVLLWQHDNTNNKSIDNSYGLTFTSIVKQVLHSILASTSTTPNLYWKNPVQSLSALLLLDFDNDNKNGNNGALLLFSSSSQPQSGLELFIRVIEFLVQYTRNFDINIITDEENDKISFSCEDNLRMLKRRLELTSALNAVLSCVDEELMCMFTGTGTAGLDTHTHAGTQHLEELLHYLSSTYLPSQLGYNKCARMPTSTSTTMNVDSEALRVSGIVLARVLCFQIRFFNRDDYKELDPDHTNDIIHFIRSQLLVSESTSNSWVPSLCDMSELGQVALLRAFSQLINSDHKVFDETGPLFVRRMIEICSFSTIVTVRLASLRALESMLASLFNFATQNRASLEPSNYYLDEMLVVAKEALEISLVNWQSNMRQVSAAVQPVFSFAIKLSQVQENTKDAFNILQLLNRILAQPANRKVREFTR